MQGVRIYEMPDCKMVSSGMLAKEVMGYEQMDYYTPVKAK